jgi:hypothetical protein
MAGRSGDDTQAMQTFLEATFQSFSIQAAVQHLD